MNLVIVGYGKSIFHDVIDIHFGRVDQFSDVFVSLRFMVAIIVP